MNPTTPNRIAIQPRTVLDLPEEEVLLNKSQAPRGGAGEERIMQAHVKLMTRASNMKYDQNATGEH